jgi:KaiC/GvpD/RAD55 family RecA-like ATPase
MTEERIRDALEKAIKKHSKGAIIVMELPVEEYMQSKSAAVKLLTGMGYGGAYISFQRPYKNLQSMLKQQGAETDDIMCIDVASAFAKGRRDEGGGKCISISDDLDIDELVRGIYTSLAKVKGLKKFIYVDSITTVTLHKPLSEIMRLCEFLRHTIRKGEAEFLIINVAKDLAQSRFVKDIALQADEVIVI